MNKKILAFLLIVVLIISTIFISGLFAKPKIRISSAYLFEGFLDQTQHSPVYEVGEEIRLAVKLDPAKMKKIGNKYNAKFSVDQYLLDLNGNVIDERKNILVYDENFDNQEMGHIFFIFFDTKDINKGTYVLRTIVNDLNFKQSAPVDKKITIKNPGIVMSSIFTGYTEDDVFIKYNDVVFERGDQFDVYFELSKYSFANGLSNVSLSMKLTNIDDDFVVFDSPDFMFLNTEEKDYKRAFPISTSELEPAIYKLTITAKDFISGNSASRFVRFDIR